MNGSPKVSNSTLTTSASTTTTSTDTTTTSASNKNLVHNDSLILPNYVVFIFSIYWLAKTWLEPNSHVSNQGSNSRNNILLANYLIFIVYMSS